MRSLLISILIFIPIFQASCQSDIKLKLITEKRGVNPKSIEKYYIDKKANKVKTGKFEKFKGKELVQTGFYKNNLQDSIWTDYSLEGKIIAQGKFQNGSKVGLWYYLSFHGDTIQIYNHTDKLMVYYGKDRENELFPPKNFPYGTASEIDTASKVIIDKMPIFIGGNTLIQNIIMTNLTYPIIDFENGKKGVSFVIFTVNKEGEIINVHTKNSISQGIDKEAVRLVKLLGNNWEPGEHNGKKVNVEFTLPLTFKID